MEFQDHQRISLQILMLIIKIQRDLAMFLGIKLCNHHMFLRKLKLRMGRFQWDLGNTPLDSLLMQLVLGNLAQDNEERSRQEVIDKRLQVHLIIRSRVSSTSVQMVKKFLKEKEVRVNRRDQNLLLNFIWESNQSHEVLKELTLLGLESMRQG